MTGPTLHLERRDPPHTPGANRGRWVHALTPLTEQPGVWHLVATWPSRRAANDAAARIKSGHAATPGGEWEFTTSAKGDTSSLFARFVGAAQRAAAAIRCTNLVVIDGPGNLS